MVKGRLHSIETFGAVDGPGIRTVFFLQGCPARCLYCHNPDSWKIGAGSEVDAETLVKRAKRGIPYYGDDGGVTFSGGEPLLQGEFLIEAIKALKKENINCAIDISGTYYDEFSHEAINQADLILLDIKHTNPKQFTKITSRSQETLFKIIEDINELGKKVWIRQVIIPGINDNEEYIESLNEFIKQIKNVEKVELLGYHNMAINKYEKLGMDYKLKDVKPMDKAKLDRLNSMVKY
ncbi:pyruvate formate-lyase-activating protein [Anaerofustis stercorihominis]|uniref:pyruvate formate-lyase-activating protein n=1 Tax=Anaerofustis stercorihominis TaxID=214853 RepID=UPI00214B2B69|nr:pyruvate formate-lyase-activating protein [Anaerofustis stercorihominis]MCR2033531.1 pyruvate formate-lyase-activating protein [Anaerofustis stercorihominis]